MGGTIGPGSLRTDLGSDWRRDAVVADVSVSRLLPLKKKSRNDLSCTFFLDSVLWKAAARVPCSRGSQSIISTSWPCIRK